MFSYEMLADKLVNMADVDWTGRENQKNTCRYGMELFIAMMVNFTIVLIVGLALGMIKEVLIYLFAWGSLRLFAGGRHASNHRSCIMIFTLAMLFIIYGCKYLMIYFDLRNVETAVMIAALIINGLYAGNHKTNQQKAVKYKLITMTVLVIQLVILCIGNGIMFTGIETDLQYHLSVLSGAVMAESIFLIPFQFSKKSKPLLNKVDSMQRGLKS